jgi:hypothetical protein
MKTHEKFTSRMGTSPEKKKKTRLMQLKHAITIGVQLLEYLTFWGFLWDFLENDVIDAVLYHET